MNNFIIAPKGFFRNNLQKERNLSAGDIWLLSLPSTSQSTTIYTSPFLSPSGPLILAHAHNTPIRSDTLQPTPMPTSTPSSLAHSLYETVSLPQRSLLPVLKSSKYMPCLSLEPFAALTNQLTWNLILMLYYIYFCIPSIF